MIRVDAVWMAAAPLDMRAGPDTVSLELKNRRVLKSTY
jgi:hypothetical protein